MTSIANDFALSWSRELLLLKRNSSHLVNGFCFFMLVGLVYQIMLGPNSMAEIVALCVIWVLALLSILLIAGGWLSPDFNSGYYELWVSQGRSLTVLFFGKILFQWLLVSLLLAALTPILALQLGLPTVIYPALVASLILTALAMVSLCALGAAVTIGQANGSLLMAILVLPLNVPPMIFGAGAIIELIEGISRAPIFVLLLALALTALTLVPPVMSFCVRIMMD